MYVIMLVALSVGLLTPLLLLLKHQCNFWRRKGIEGPSPIPIFGNLFKFVVTKQRHIGEIYKDIYDFYRGARYVGIFKLTTPALLIRDLDIVRDIMIANFNRFNKNDFNFDPKLDPLIALNPFLSHGETWKTSRAILSPLFSPNKVKAAVPCVEEISRVLEEYLDRNHQKANQAFCVKDIANKFTTDVIVKYALSVDADSFGEPPGQFREMGDNIFKPTFLTGLKQQTVLFLPFMNNFLKIPFVPKAVDKDFRKAITEIAGLRHGMSNPPNDLLSQIIDCCKTRLKADYDETFVAGHSMSVVKGAYETSSTNFAYALFELARNPEIQAKVQNEVDIVFAQSGGVITDRALRQMEYLELCLIETARMHCPFFHTTRVSLQDFELPPQFGDSNEKVEIEAGTLVVIPINAIHYDPDNYNNPEVFDPERWSAENRESIPKYAFLGFGEGPRLCIGMKFGLQQVKGGIARILSKYTLKPYERTDIPEKFSKATFNLQPENGIWLKFIERRISDNFE